MCKPPKNPLARACAGALDRPALLCFIRKRGPAQHLDAKEELVGLLDLVLRNGCLIDPERLTMQPGSVGAVSYTHLDVNKRQSCM